MITCYLDSQDYSALTDPKLDSPPRRQIKDALLHLARSRQVRFAFSAAAVCESVSLKEDTAHLAELKAELLYELCGSNALVSYDRLVGAEANALVHKSDAPNNMFDPHGRWFPKVSIDETPQNKWDGIRALAEADLKVMGLTRQQRRAKVRTFIKKGKPSPELNALLAQQDPHAFAADLLKKYPMRPEDAEVVGKYALGQATEKEFTEALMSSLADPRWMMKWFTTQHAMSSPISDIVRKPGRELGQQMRLLVEVAVRWADTLRKAGIDADPTGKNGEITSRWRRMEEGQIIAIISRMANAKNIQLGAFEVSDVYRCCPGIATGIRALYSSVWANVGEGRKEDPSDSQPVDALHAFYAPYVQIFRADKFMAPHIQKYVKNAGTIVVPRLSQLIETIEKELK